MTRYEMRTKDLKKILGIWAGHGVPTKDWIEVVISIQSIRRDAVLVLYEWESPEEADKARLDYMEGNRVGVWHGYGDGPNGEPTRSLWVVDGCGLEKAQPTLRDAIDVARNAPKPKIVPLVGEYLKAISVVH
jgi:hypothetical protein